MLSTSTSTNNIIDNDVDQKIPFSKVVRIFRFEFIQFVDPEKITKNNIDLQKKNYFI